MRAARRFGRVLHWRRWWDLAQVSFAGWLLLVLLGGPDAVGRLTGVWAITPVLELVANWGFQAGLASLLVGFALLHLRQESDSTD
ncbi:hypothetical protein I7X12_11050 [Halosimplex litoreum]|uniref:Uncharacterized protein n=1 Tax=Halosimplex litoreum TaxID=1198301 RepID=A0A7T3FV93_9EURY|nr:hypothetical protein [Halosimplex litoreum]QPV61307.1 hypothetical protein I7X12_11050 [Halosimplex litoreum]